MVDLIEWPVEHAEDVEMQHMLRLSAETGIPASTLAGLRDGSLVAVKAEFLKNIASRCHAALAAAPEPPR